MPRGALTKAQCARVAELQRFWELDRLQKLGVIFCCPEDIDQAAREARALVRQILRRAPLGHTLPV